MRKSIAILLITISLVLSGCFGKKTTNEEVKEVSISPAGELPIVDEKVTLKVLVQSRANIENFETNEFTKWYEEQTNVHIDWEVVPPKDAQEKLNLILTSGEYPDVIMGFGISPTMQMVYGMQGVFRPMNDYIDKYGYGTKRLFEEVEGAEEAIKAPDGNIYGLPQIDANPHTASPQKLWIYEPWLKKLNLDMPTTTEEFYQVLKAFKTQDPNGNGKADEIPLAGATTGWHAQIDNFLMNAFIYTHKLGNGYTILDNGKVDVVFNKPEWKKGLEFLHKLYDEGLLAPETFTQDIDQLRRLGENPDVPILGVAPGGTMEFTQIGGESGRWQEYVTIPPLKGPDQLQVAPYSLEGLNANAQFVITSAAKYPEVAYRWGEMMYTEEITIRNDNGTLGEHWDWAEEGEIGLNGKQGSWKKLVQPSGIQNFEWEHTGPILQTRELREGLVTQKGELAQILYEETVKNYDPYRQDVDKIVPPLFFSESQASELATLEKTIRDYVNEMLARFVTGDADISKEWDKYLDTLVNMNLKRFVEIYQEAYDVKYK
nr:ABC transporter substrate-binding protein [Paenibacillus bovis]